MARSNPSGEHCTVVYPGHELNMKEAIGDRIIEGLQEFTDALKDRETVSEQLNCRRIVLDLHPTRYDPKLVRQTRDLLNASQAVFASFLGVSANTVQAWEQGVNAPNDMACRFMDEIRHDPEHWLERRKEIVIPKATA